MAVKNVTELDFTSIKNNLKTFLKNQDEFADYNFEASGISTLIDLLAYNTHYNAVLAHMVSNELSWIPLFAGTLWCLLQRLWGTLRDLPVLLNALLI